MEDDIRKDSSQIKRIVLETLSGLEILFNLIEGEFRDEALKNEKKSFVDDVDIVVYSHREFVEKLLEDHDSFVMISRGSYRFDYGNRSITVDLYYHKIYSSGFQIVVPVFNHELRIEESYYLLYLLLDPILKFGEYKPRHIFQIEKYKEKEAFRKEKFTILFSKIFSNNYEETLDTLLSLDTQRIRAEIKRIKQQLFLRMIRSNPTLLFAKLFVHINRIWKK